MKAVQMAQPMQHVLDWATHRAGTAGRPCSWRSPRSCPSRGSGGPFATRSACTHGNGERAGAWGARTSGRSGGCLPAVCVHVPKRVHVHMYVRAWMCGCVHAHECMRIHATRILLCRACPWKKK